MSNALHRMLDCIGSLDSDDHTVAKILVECETELRQVLADSERLERQARASYTEDEIEITAEMLEAGECALAAYDPRFELREDAVRRVWIAMDRARRCQDS